MQLDLRLGDCLNVLKTIPDNSVDLIITSPPYNIGNTHHTNKHRFKAYDDNIPEDEYQLWQIDVLNECYRVLKNDGSMFYNHKNRIKNGEQISPYQWLFKTPFIIKQELVWFNGSPNFDKIRFYPQTERIYWLTKDRKTKLYNAISHNDVFDAKQWKPQGTQGVFKRAYPIELPRDIMLCFPDAKIVLDPFMGSGTTGVACKKLCKDFIGIEINEEYFNIAKQRIEETTRWDDLE